MHLPDFLIGAFVYLAAAVIAAPIASRLGLGSVLGYLAAGILIGPAVLGLVGSEGQDVMHFAEFGVIVMLFLVGLELQPSKLWSLRKPILGLGGLQVSGTALAMALVGYVIGLDWKAAMVSGLILAMSSTAIVIQSLNERGQLKTFAGQSSFSVLLFQDIAVIPMLALLPLLAVHQSASHQSTSLIASLPAWAQTLSVLAAVAAIVLAGRYLMRPLFRFVAQSGIREIFVAFALLIVVGITLLMQLVGLSAALGTFLAGVVLAESEYRHELEMDLDPFKGLLLAVFFMAVGAGIDFNLLMANPIQILGLVVGFVLLKLVVLYAIARIFRMKGPDSAHFASSLAQGGEFAFVLISFCLGLGLLAAGQASLLVAIVAISMALAPLLMIANEKLIQPLFASGGEIRNADVIDESARVIIAGHGRFGMTVGRMLQGKGYKTVVLDHDAEQIDALRKFGFKLFYGDASRVDLLEAAGAHTAEILVVAVDEREKISEIVATAKKHFPNLRIFARAFDRVHAYELINAGVNDAYREVFSSSLDMAEDVLAALGQHPFEAHRAAKAFKKFDEKIVREQARHAGDTDKMVDIARNSRAELSRVLAGDRAVSPLGSDQAWEDNDGRS
ncbi:MAG: monovalent cation:proton antiporter-2 (CPA2) family protein [Aestuariivirga sp.]